MFYWILITLLHTTHKNTRRNKSHFYSYLVYIHHRPNYEQQALARRLLQRGHYYTNSTVLFCETGYCLKAANSFELLSQKNSIIDVQQCPQYASADTRAQRLNQKIIHLVRLQNAPKKYVYASRGKKCLFFRKCCKRTK